MKSQFNADLQVERDISQTPRSTGEGAEFAATSARCIQRRRRRLVTHYPRDGRLKDGAIRHVVSGVNPQGCQVFSFKHPHTEELEYDSLKPINDPSRNWKFSWADIKERKFWRDYMRSYEACMSATSTAAVPWQTHKPSKSAAESRANTPPCKTPIPSRQLWLP